ncbi:hypothetical protein D1O33_26065 (plasmid) [Rhodococcus rhodochrous]|uniref:hypothetical protein n=1 Tax=Rhodococcus rhodochrous TaxID=1829 RepID=UPI00132F43E2|nr:hypothetical protein [Rhodococcus rhodochrous]QHG85472.1 hypothetical protein D1O33_26065 [Rhodococcus rhodochrous]
MTTELLATRLIEPPTAADLDCTEPAPTTQHPTPTATEITLDSEPASPQPDQLSPASAEAPTQTLRTNPASEPETTPT